MEVENQQLIEQQEDQEQLQQQQNDKKLKSKLSVITQPEILYETANEFASKMASTVLGQYAIDKIDKVLSIIEKTAKWSLPQSEQATNNADKATDIPSTLDRPLPWIPFLAAIVALRAVRISLSFAAILIGNEPISASAVVYFIQTRRRKLRYIKYNGLRVIRQRQQEAEERQRLGVIQRFSAIFGAIMCRPGQQNHDACVKIIYKKGKKSMKKSQGRKQSKSLLNSEEIGEDELNMIAAGGSHNNDENIPIEVLYHHLNDNNESSEESDFTLEEEEDATLNGTGETSTDSENDEKIEEKRRQKEAENMEKNKKLLEQLLQQKQEQLENEIKSKLESQIEERIAFALNAKLGEKIEEIQGIHHEQQQLQQQQEQQQQQQQYINNNYNNNNNNNNNNNEIPDNPSSVAINPPKLSPQIAQNGNIDDENDLEISHSHTSLNNRNKEFKGSPTTTECDRNFENYSTFKANTNNNKIIMKQKDELNAFESNLPFIENELKTNLQINLMKPSSAAAAAPTKKYHSIGNTQSSRIKMKK